jgi:hypothetical protein
MFLNLWLFSCHFHSNLSCQLVTANDEIHEVLSLYNFILKVSGSNLGLVTVCNGRFFVPFLDLCLWHRVVWKVSTNVSEEHIDSICKRKFVTVGYGNYSAIFFTWSKILKIKSEQHMNLTGIRIVCFSSHFTRIHYFLFCSTQPPKLTSRCLVTRLAVGSHYKIKSNSSDSRRN